MTLMKRVGTQRGRRRCYLTSATLVLMGWTTTAMAQTPVTITEEGGGMLDWAIATGLAAIVCVAGFWNPKRSHQN